MKRLSLCGMCFALAFSGAAGLSSARAQAVLTPFVGEKASEFELRKRSVRDVVREQEGAAYSAHGTIYVVPGPTGQYLVESHVGTEPVTMIIDTGSSVVALTYSDAIASGLNPSGLAFSHRMDTANGVVSAARVTIPSVRLGDILLTDVDGVVLPPGSLSRSLLGMSFLTRLKGVHIVDGRLQIRG